MQAINFDNCEISAEDSGHIYLSKPIDEYNIIEKIKEANKELFALESLNTSKIDDSATSLSSKKVKFAVSLEADESKEKIEQKMCDNYKKEDNKEKDVVKVLLETVESNLVPLRGLETTWTVGNKEKIKTLSLASCGEDNVASEKRINRNIESLCNKMQTSMEMNKRNNFQGQGQKSRSKQTTIDLDKDYYTNEFDNELESTNFAEKGGKLHNENNHISHIADHVNNDSGDNDDILSMLVASYIPDNFRTGEFRRESDHQTTKPRTNYVLEQRSPNNTSKSSTYLPPPEVTTLKFNYRMCCEYRHARQEKLPKYTGYLSEYGLSHGQLAERKEKLRRRQRAILEKGLEANDEELRRMQDNERAFIKWLKCKMRFPPNKTRNMYDTPNYSRVREATEQHKSSIYRHKNVWK